MGNSQTVRQDSRNRLVQAGAATQRIGEHGSKAARALSQGVEGRIMINAASGALADPKSRRADLLIARDEINKALEILDATAWPSAADYDIL